MNLISSKEYPLLENGLVYFDSGSLMPLHKKVIADTVEAMKISAPVGRGLYKSSEHATYLYEKARSCVAKFINASHDEVAFFANSTYALNSLALSFRNELKVGDEIVVSELEHHSNLIPWQELCQHTGAVLKIVKANLDSGVARFDLENYKTLLSSKTKIVSFVAVSNVVGAIEPVAEIVKLAHSFNAFVVVDAAQYVPHYKTDVKTWQADAVIFSGHKMGAVPSIAALYLKQDKIDTLKPAIFGGGMVFEVSPTKSTFLENIKKFEAGTPVFVNALSLESAINLYEDKIDFQKLKEHEAKLSLRLQEGLKNIGAKIYSAPEAHLVTFSLENFHAHDVAAWCDNFNIAVRAGDHCAQPLHKILNYSGTVRATFGPYNSLDDVNYFLESLSALNLKV